MASTGVRLLLIAAALTIASVYVASAADIYVDASATGANNGSSWEDAFTTIQAGISAALPGDVVWVNRGVYNENIDFLGKPITVTSIDPLNPAVVASTVIDGGGNGSVVKFVSGESNDSVLTGFTIQNGTGTLIDGVTYGGGIYCGIGCSPTIRHNIIINCTADVGGAIYTRGNTPPQITDGPSASYPYAGKGEEITLSVTAQDLDGDILTYTWTPLDGGSILVRDHP